VTLARSRYAERLEPYFQDTAQRFFQGLSFQLRVQAGWDSAEPLETLLEQELPQDLRHGHTQSGPHKGDFSIALNGRSAKAYLSRGQTKLLVYALLLAQSRLMEERAGASGCVLIDDVASELDQANKRTLLGFLSEGRTQYFITATDRAMIKAGLGEDAALFEIGQGQVARALSIRR